MTNHSNELFNRMADFEKRGDGTLGQLEATPALLRAQNAALVHLLTEAEKTPQNGTEGRMRSREEIKAIINGGGLSDREGVILNWVLGED